MTTIVIMPGGFHPFHAGHLALYDSAREAFPGSKVFVAATNDTSARPFPFAVKEKLAKLAGVAPRHFVQVQSPFRAEEITSKFDPARDRLIFVRSEKDANKPPQAGGVKRDGSAAYLQPLAGQTNIRPFKEHAYMAYLPTVEFGPGMTSATEIRTAWPTLNEKRKTALVMSLYPRTQSNLKLANTVVKLLDAVIGTQDVTEDITEAVGGNYLYHSTQDANTAKQILSSGYILGNTTGKQSASDAQTKLPTVSFGRSIGYQTSGANVDRDYQVVFVFDRASIETRYKTLGTSQSQTVRGLANPIDTEWGRKVTKFGKAWGLDANADGKVDYKEIGNASKSTASNLVKQGVSTQLNAPKAGGEFEEIVPTKTGKIPLQGLLVGFYLVPGKAASKDPELLNDPRRLDMIRPNQFVKAARPQGVAEGWKDEADDFTEWSNHVKEKLSKASPEQRLGLAKQLSQLEVKHFGSTVPNTFNRQTGKPQAGLGLTDTVRNALKYFNAEQTGIRQYNDQDLPPGTFGDKFGSVTIDGMENATPAELALMAKAVRAGADYAKAAGRIYRETGTITQQDLDKIKQGFEDNANKFAASIGARMDYSNRPEEPTSLAQASLARRDQAVAESTGPGVDAKGRTQAQWYALVKAKFPPGGPVTVVKLIQAKMPDGQIIAYLSNGKQIGWKKVEKIDAKKAKDGMDKEQGVAEGLDDNDTAKAAYMHGLRHGREGAGDNMDRAQAEWGNDFKYYNAGFLKGRNQKAKSLKAAGQGVAEGLFGIDDKIKGRIQNVVSDLSDIPGMWDHKAQTFTDAGMDKLKTVLKNNPKYIKYALNLDYRDYEAEGVAENFADGKNPGRKGLSKRVGVNTKASVSSLRKTAKNSSGEKQRMAHWLANMKAGRAKAKKEDIEEELQHNPVDENQGWAATLEHHDYIEEKWSKKYKSSINCANPQGFSQKAHCAGRKK